MQDYLNSVDWEQMGHAYGAADDVPGFLRGMTSEDSETAAAAWNQFYGAVNHQGDFYDSTVAAIPYLIGRLLDDDATNKQTILDYFRSRWDDAVFYGGDPLADVPPGGKDIPTPKVGDSKNPAFELKKGVDQDGEEYEEEHFNYRPMNLCAWQTGRAILKGIPCYKQLLSSEDTAIAVAAAELLMRWKVTRAEPKTRLVELINAVDSGKKAELILKLGVYGDIGDNKHFSRWIDSSEPTVKAAALLAMAWTLAPEPLTQELNSLVASLKRPQSRAFADLAHEGVFARGVWILPESLQDIVFDLGENEDDELRWRSIQAFSKHMSNFGKRLDPHRTVALLLKRLDDKNSDIRRAASEGLTERATVAIRYPQVIEKCLERINEDAEATIRGQCARLLMLNRNNLSNQHLSTLREGLENAARTFKSGQQWVNFGSMGIAAEGFFRGELEKLDRSSELSLLRMFEAYFEAGQDSAELGTEEVSRIICSRFEAASNDVIAEATRILNTFFENKKGDDDDPHEDGVRIRNAAVGVTQWAATLGPHCEPLIGALDRIGTIESDSYAKDQAAHALESIKVAMAIKQCTTVDPLLKPSLSHNDLVAAAQDLGVTPIGVTGQFQSHETFGLYRVVYQSRRYEAIKAILAREEVVEDLVDSMIDLACTTEVSFGDQRIPFSFSDQEWKKAIRAAGGFAAVEQRLRTARVEAMGHTVIDSCCGSDGQTESSDRHIGVPVISRILDLYSGRRFPITN